MRIKRRTWITAAAVGTLVVAGLALGPTALARSRVETPKYKVEADYGSFEVRRYEPRLVAEVTVRGDGRKASNAGFRVLADFIFGNNSTSTEVAMTAPVDRTAQKIEMTAPVERTASSVDEWVIAFTMPSKYTLETLPVPNDKRIRVRELPARRYAVLRFSGAPREAAVERKIREFVALVDASDLARTGAEPIYARYDPPWTPGLCRRNEIFVELGK